MSSTEPLRPREIVSSLKDASSRGSRGRLPLSRKETADGTGKQGTLLFAAGLCLSVKLKENKRGLLGSVPRVATHESA